MRALAVSFLLILASSAVHAQARLGLSLGGDFGSDVLFRGAVPLEIRLGSLFVLRPELAFKQQQTQAILRNLNPERRYFSSTTAYLELPLLIKAELRFRSWSMFGLVGPSVSYGLRVTAWYTDRGVLQTDRISWREAAIRPLDLGMVAGLGGQKTLPQGYVLFLDFRYQLGLLDLNRREGGAAIFNQGKAFTLGFLIPLRKKTGAILPQDGSGSAANALPTP